MSRHEQKKSNKPGKPPITLKIDGSWEDAVGKAVGKKRPADGWPAPDPVPQRAPKTKKKVNKKV